MSKKLPVSNDFELKSPVTQKPFKAPPWTWSNEEHDHFCLLTPSFDTRTVFMQQHTSRIILRSSRTMHLVSRFGYQPHRPPPASYTALIWRPRMLRRPRRGGPKPTRGERHGEAGRVHGSKFRHHTGTDVGHSSPRWTVRAEPLM